MDRRLARSISLLAATVIFATAPLCRAQSPDQVNQAINRGIDFLKSKQRNGRWEDYGPYTGGTTALAVVALHSCDVPADDARIESALKYLRTLPPEATYVVALQTMALAAAGGKKDYPIIKRNAEWLITDGRRLGGQWSYGSGMGPVGIASGDNSNTQFALLGLHAASEAGVNVPAEFWQRCRTHWTRTQNNRAGSWGYGRAGATGSMTAAGIASLVITGREIERVKEGMVDGMPVRCDGAVEDRALENAINWIGRNFSATQNPGRAEHLYYYLYGIERAGRLTGRRFFGRHDWYRAGVRHLIASQSAAGSWGGQGTAGLYNTSFALLFLSKGRIPILVDKLRFGRNADWNNAPDDVHNLTNFVGEEWKTRLNWQVVDIRSVRRVEDLLQAPILQFSGHQAPVFSAREKTLLREYVEQGGLLIADANCTVKAFDQGFRELCRELFPEPGQELRRLDPGHGVWSSHFNLIGSNWPLYGVEMGCRTGVFYSPEDLSCNWQFVDELDDPNGPALPAFRLGTNMVAYAVGPEDLMDKLDKRKVYADEGEDEIRRNFLQVAKVRHSGDWNPAPGAVRNLMSSLREVAKIDVVRQQRDIDLLDPNLVNYPLAYMHGRTKFRFNRREKEMLKKYLEEGGVLFADACCGSERFDGAFRELVKELFPERTLEPIPVEHELFGSNIGYDIRRVKFGKGLGGKEVDPALEGIEIDGRYAIIYSRYDIGCALERQQGGDCKSYTHESALRIATNVALYALKQ